MTAMSAEYHRDYYARTRERRIELKNPVRRSARKRNRDYVQAYLRTHPCVDCGEDDPVVLEFDHVRGQKRNDISRLVASCSIASLEAEIAKCEVRCANDHRRVTHKRRSVA